MTQRRKISGTVFLGLLIYLNCSRSDDFPVLKGPYLGQTPPSSEPRLFAPGLLSTATGSELNISFSPDGDELLYCLITKGQSGLPQQMSGLSHHRFIFYSNLKDGRWTEPWEWPFLKGHVQWHPNFSPDGNRIFFNSKRSDIDPAETRFPNIWFVEKKNGQWSNPKEIDFGPDYDLWTGVRPSIAESGNLYFTLYPDRQNGSIYISRYLNGEYNFPEQLGPEINDGGANHPHISPDERYLLFDRNGDLFISFRDSEGKWSDSISLGDRVNTEFTERRPFVTFDGKYLFFASNRGITHVPDNPVALNELRQKTAGDRDGNEHLYWIDASFIDDILSKWGTK